MNPIIVQVNTQSKCITFPALRNDFCQQEIHNMSKEVGVETSLTGIRSTK
jgi:hypothetical protein